tara:strand:- start:1382 stop:2062 length:681 start_codon:yes stop_codon:yes gene_type:complete
MKKFVFISLFTLFSSISVAHMAHYNNYKKIEMEIFRNGKLIGFSNYFFNRKGNETIITNQTKFSVKILGAIIFKVEGYSSEKYLKDQLISFNSKTLQNNKEKFVNLIFDESAGKFNIKGSSNNGEASVDNIIGNWWNHKILQANSQISPISGSIKEQVVTFIGKEKIEQYGTVYNVSHFTLKSKDISLPKNKKLDFNIWYDEENFRIIKISYSKMGNWEYRLKSFE